MHGPCPAVLMMENSGYKSHVESWLMFHVRAGKYRLIPITLYLNSLVDLTVFCVGYKWALYYLSKNKHSAWTGTADLPELSFSSFIYYLFLICCNLNGYVSLHWVNFWIYFARLIYLNCQCLLLVWLWWNLRGHCILSLINSIIINSKQYISVVIVLLWPSCIFVVSMLSQCSLRGGADLTAVCRQRPVRCGGRSVCLPGWHDCWPRDVRHGQGWPSEWVTEEP